MSTCTELHATSKKRKVDLLDYFTLSTGKPKKVHCTSNCTDTQSTTPSSATIAVPGLSILQDFVTKQEEAALIAFLDAQQWRTDLARRVIHYGGIYCLMPPRGATPTEKKTIESTIYTAAAIPSELDLVIDRMVQRGLYTPQTRPQYCIVNSYTENQGISAHVENFRFASPVCGLTLGDGDWMRFHELVAPDDGSVRSGRAAQAGRTGRRVDVRMSSRSLLVMDGEARMKWQHEIVRGRRDRGPAWRRVSLTFRTLKVNGRGG